MVRVHFVLPDTVRKNLYKGIPHRDFNTHCLIFHLDLARHHGQWLRIVP
jgi:hypothetical protein